MFDVSVDECMHRLTLKWSDQDHDTLPAWVAETDFPLALTVRRALINAIDDSDVGYPPRDGVSPLGAAWSRWLAATYSQQVPVEAVHPLPGAVRGLYAAIWAFTPPAGTVVVTPPIYKPFLEAPLDLGRRRVDVPLVRVAGRHALDLEGLERAFAGGGSLLLLCHPHNPTGTVFRREELEALARLADTHGVVVLSDEVHAPLVMPGVEFTPYAVAAGELSPRSMSLVSMSKAFSFAGLHCAAAVVGADVEHRWMAVPRRLRSGSGMLGIVATLAALEPEGQAWLQELVTVLDANRRHLVEVLPDHLPGARAELPDATYLLWVDCRDTTIADDPEGVLLRRGVRVSPGEEFGAGGEGHLRLNFATSRPVLDDILERMRG